MANDPLCYGIVSTTEERAQKWLASRHLEFDPFHFYINTTAGKGLVGRRNITLVFVDIPDSYILKEIVMLAAVSFGR